MYLPKYGESPYFGIFYLKIDYLKINNDIMTLYSKWFNTHNEYEAYKNGQNYILPNVSICYQDHDVHYQKVFDPYNGHEYVDLGLPSGTLWAKCNVGAETETDYGLYFQWGDTQGYTADQVGTDKAFTWNDYKYGVFDEEDPDWGMTKYNSTDGKTTLDITDDAARVNMGGEWHMPTYEQALELENLSKDFTTISGVYGVQITGNNGNTLFIPWAGAAVNNRLNSGLGRISTATLAGNMYDSCWYYQSDSESAGYIETYGRLLGVPVRGVIG